MRTSDASMAPLVAVFSATVSAEELRAILLSSAAGADQHPARRRELADVAQHLHLTRDSLHTLPDMGYAEVVTTDAALADALEFTDAEVIDVASRTKRVLVRAPGSRDWQRVGVVSCGPSQPLLPPLLTDMDVPAACTCPTTTPLARAPRVWQWVGQVVADAAPIMDTTWTSASPAQAAMPWHAQAVQQQQQQHVVATPMAEACTSQQQPELATAPAAAASESQPIMACACAPQAEAQQQQQSQPAAEVQDAAATRGVAAEAAHTPVLAARACGLVAGCSTARAACFTSSWQAVVRAASGRASTDGWRPRPAQERRQGGCLSRAGAALGLEGVAPGAGVGKAAVPAGGLPVFLQQAAGRLASVHSRSLPLISH